MNDLFNDIKIYLPKYLSEDEQNKLFDQLSSFPDNIDKRFYTNHLKNKPNLFQGDLVRKILVPDYDKSIFREAKGFLISNTCDMNLKNSRLYVPFLVFSPIFSLQKYKNALLRNHSVESVSSHIEGIRKQKSTTFFYLPMNGEELDECFVRFDNLFSFPIDEKIVNDFISERLFSLSNYGFYLLLYKLSIHFTRIQERVQRDAN